MRLGTGTLRAVCGLTIFALSVATASGQNIITARMDGQPLVYMKDGNLTGCGVRLVVVDVPPQLTDAPVPLYDVSFNLHMPGHGVVKAVSNDVPGTQMKTGKLQKGSLRPKPLASFWLKAPDTSATKPLGSVAKGDDPGSMLYSSDLDSVLPLFAAQSAGIPILLGTKRQGATTERIFSGVVSMAKEEQAQIDQCLKEFITRAAR